MSELIDGGGLAPKDLLEQEHREHQGPLRELVTVCEELTRGPERLPDRAARVARAAAALERHFGEHLGREEEVIFPAVRRLLDPGASAAIVRELRERRGGGPRGAEAVVNARRPPTGRPARSARAPSGGGGGAVRG